MKYVIASIVLALIITACSRERTAELATSRDSGDGILANPGDIASLVEGESVMHSHVRRLVLWMDSIHVSEAPAGSDALWEDVVWQLRQVFDDDVTPVYVSDVMVEENMALIAFHSTEAVREHDARRWLLLGQAGSAPVFLNMYWEPEPADVVSIASRARELLAGILWPKQYRDTAGAERIALDPIMIPDTTVLYGILSELFTDAAIEQIARRIGLHTHKGRCYITHRPDLRTMRWEDSLVHVVDRSIRGIRYRFTVDATDSTGDAVIEMELEMTFDGWKIATPLSEHRTAAKQS